MTDQKEDVSFPVLPRAFAAPFPSGSQAVVDIDLINIICHTYESPGKKARALLEQLQDERPSKKEDALTLLSERIPSGEFRRNWYSLFEKPNAAKKKNLLPPLFDLVDTFISQKCGGLEFTSDVLKPCFERRKGKTFPKLDQLPALCDQLDLVSATSPRFAALFAWSLIERTQWQYLETVKDASPLDFARSLRNELAQRGNQELLDLLEPGAWPPTSRMPPFEAHPEGKCISNQEQPAAPTIEISSEPEAESAEPTYQKQIADIDLSIRTLITDVAEQADRLRQSLATDGPAVELQQISNSAGELATCAGAILHTAEDLISALTEDARSRLQPFGIALTALDSPNLILTSNNAWLKFASQQVRFANQISNKVNALIEGGSFPEGSSGFGSVMRVSTLQDALDLLSSQEQRIRTAREGFAARQRIVEVMKQFSTDFSWSPLNAPGIDSEDWVSLARSMVMTSRWTPALGVLIRTYFDKLKEECAFLLDAIERDASTTFTKQFELLSLLTLDQLEALDRENPIVRTTIGLVELQAFLDSSENGMSIDKCFGYWSATPLATLSQFETKHCPPIFRSAFEVFRDEEEATHHCLSILREAIQRGINQAPAADGANPTQRLEQRLREILTFHPGGGQTYANLWEQAYKMLCTPILGRLDRDGLESALDECRVILRDFDIDDHLHTWKQNIPDQLKTRSEYGRKVRLAAEAKKRELREFLGVADNALIKSDAHKQTGLNRLAKDIRTALETTDTPSDLIRQWTESILRTSGEARVVLVQRTGSLDPSLSEPIHGPTSGRYARCAAAQRSGDPVVAGSYFADLLFAELSPIGDHHLLEAFLQQGMLEQCAQLTLEIGDDLPPDLERQIHLAIEVAEENYHQQVETLAKAIESSAPDEVAEAALLDIRRLFEEQKWSALERELNQLQRLVEANASVRNELEEIERLKEELRKLGAHAPDIASAAELARLYKRERKERVERNPMLRPVNQLLELPSLNPEVRQLAENYIGSMIQTGAIKEAADQLEILMPEVFGNLREELRRYRHLKESYQAKLLELTRKTIHFLTPIGGHPLGERSPILTFLWESNNEWQRIPEQGEEVVGMLLGQLEVRCGGIEEEVPTDQLPMAKQKSSVAPTNTPSDATSGHPKADKHGPIISLIEPLLRLIHREQKNLILSATPRESEMQAALLNDDWAGVESLSAQAHLASPDKELGRYHLAGWAAVKLRKSPAALSTEEFAGALILANLYPEHPAFRGASSQKAVLGDLAKEFVSRIVRDNGGNSSAGSWREHLQELATNVRLLGTYRLAFAAVFSADAKGRAPLLRALWDAIPSDKKQAEARAALMTIFWRLSASESLACCLTYPPIGLEARKANALAMVAKQALVEGKPQLLQSFFDLKKTVEAKPFVLFVHALHISGTAQTEAPAQLKVVSKLNKVAGEAAFEAMLAVIPRASERPERMTLTLPTNSTLRFNAGQHPLKLELPGPFLEDETLCRLTLQVANPNVTRFVERMVCDAISITGEPSTFLTDLEFEIADAIEFSPPTVDEIYEAFAGFRSEQMRGEEYVTRAADENRIEKSLFAKTVRSLWISSPRRSGKTTMLYRILDHYSHKNGRSDLVVYLDLNESFYSTTDFNKWLWKALRSTPQNKELRDLFDNFDVDVGKDLSYDTNVATFIGRLSDLLKDKCRKRPIDRVIFLFDEVDRFATMHFAEGTNRDVARDVLWQVRNLLSDRRDIGFVFAGSSAANKIFVTSHDAPFFGRGIGFELTPFSCDNGELEKAARQIVEPPRISGRFKLDRKTLQHLLWVCAGIPYYMKLLAGATYAVSKQPHLIPADVNQGLWKLLDKNTGIDQFDSSSDIPGSDELSTVALPPGSDKLLLQAVIFAAAETKNPLGGHVLRRAQLYSDDSILVSRYGLDKTSIQRGLELAIEHRILKISGERQDELTFSIPILGEAIARNISEFWGEITTKLDNLRQKV